MKVSCGCMREILSYYVERQQITTLKQWLGGKEGNILHLNGLAGSSPAVIAACLLEDLNKNHVFILPDKESAAYFHDDLFNLSGNEDILFFPSSFKRSVQYTQKSSDNIVQRTEVLKRLSQDAAGQVIITFPEALVEKTVSGHFLADNAFPVGRQDRLSLSFLADFLETCHFQEVDYVYEPGQFSIRGSILDVSPTSLTIEVTGTEEKVQGMINLLRDFRIREVVRSGKIAISRENKLQPGSRK